MANTKSAEKRNRQALKRRARNSSVKTSVKTAVKNARQALSTKEGSALQDAFKNAVKSLSKAASKGVLHKKNASRRISRLAKAVAGKKA